MIFKNLKADITVEDEEFDTIFPAQIRTLSAAHFTPIEESIAASRFLAGIPEAKVLDIGSGAGKFCMIGAACTTGHFTGVEQRGNLCAISEQIAADYHLSNVRFIHSNITDIAFEDYNAFYFFNPFYEHIFRNGGIDEAITLDKNLYTHYVAYVKEQLGNMPEGTRLVTFHTHAEQIPDTYLARSVSEDERLVMWEKVS